MQVTKIVTFYYVTVTRKNVTRYYTVTFYKNVTRYYTVTEKSNALPLVTRYYTVTHNLADMSFSQVSSLLGLVFQRCTNGVVLHV